MMRGLEMENETKDTKKKIGGIIAIIAVIAIVVGGVAGVIIGKRIKAYRDYVAEQKFKEAQQEVLNEELEKILAMDPIVDEVDQTIYTEKDFATIEKAMKNYFTDFFAVTKSVNAFPTDERFAVLMNQDQMLADAPDFANTLAAIDTLKTEYSTDVDTLSEMVTKNKINSYLDADLEQEYVDIYEDMMTSGSTVTAETELQDQLTTSRDQVNGVLDKYKTMIDYLVANKDGWQLEGTTFMFTDQGTLDQYNAYVDDLNQAVSTLSSEGTQEDTAEEATE